MGASLGRAAEVLASEDPGRQLDERGQRERRGTTRMLRRIGAIWPTLFEALNEESEILDATLRSAAAAARAQQRAPTEDRASAATADPLARYRLLLFELDQMVILLHEHGEQPWAQDALRSLRRGLFDAAEVQGREVDDMLAV